MAIDTDPGQTVERLLRAQPETARVFLRRKMACVGCVMSPFETVGEVARIYGIAEGELLADLAAAARKG
ncbi:MAG TPA: DUF1858 domain-containing protein [Stellaceae bacterium]